MVPPSPLGLYVLDSSLSTMSKLERNDLTHDVLREYEWVWLKKKGNTFVNELCFSMSKLLALEKLMVSQLTQGKGSEDFSNPRGIDR